MGMDAEPGKYAEAGAVLGNVGIAPRVHVVEFEAPRICAAARPGQFVHVKVADAPVQLLRMPFAVYDVHPDRGSIDICFQVVGEGTKQLSRVVPGAMLKAIGPIGNGWHVPEDARRILLVSGGLGAAPLNMLAREQAARGVRVDVVMGAATSELVVCRDRLEPSAVASGGDLHIATDDGSEGVHGFALDVSNPLIAANGYGYACFCGPFPMMKFSVPAAIEAGVPAEVSMERLMACGVGACLSCVVETVGGRRRCCVDGPVFDASEVVW